MNDGGKKYWVTVFESKSGVWDECSQYMDFGFDNFDDAFNFVKDMVDQHGKAVVFGKDS